MVYAGHLDVYARGAELIEKFLRVETNTAQIYRVTNHHAERLSPVLYQPSEALAVDATEVVYAEIDGSMIFTDNQWREVKLGRVFASGAVEAACSLDRGGHIEHSEYTGHLGSFEEFTAKFRLTVDKYAALGERLVFVVDGALWIQRWIREQYPHATQILDFYHAAEHIGEFARLAIDDPTERGRWIASQKALLLAGSLERVIGTIKRMLRKHPDVKEQAERLMDYYRNNSARMRYDEYIKRGLSIGSGAIESAHRTVVQRRMKLSGQRWANTGAEHVLDLRVCALSGKWDMVVDLIRKPHPAVS
jgi:hypothetical protein